MGNRPRTVSIHILDDDSLLHVFYLYRPFLFGEDQDDNSRLLGGDYIWARRGRWWYGLAHVCKRWRKIILGSAYHLVFSLVCTYGTPVADMLVYSPFLPLVVDYHDKDRVITAEDEEGIILALKQRHRVLRVRFTHTSQQTLKFIAAMDEDYPILEYLVITPPIKDNDTIHIIPESFQAPHLRLLRLKCFVLPMGSQLLTTAVGLVILSLVIVDASTYFHPNTLLQWISIMPQLEVLSIIFIFSIPNRDVARQLMHTPTTPLIVLPNLRYFDFQGVSTYLEEIVHRIATPRLMKLKINFFNQLTFSFPPLQLFMNVAENLKSNIAAFTFDDKSVSTVVYPYAGTKVYTLGIVVKCCHLDWQVSCMAQISNSLSQMYSTVEYLALQYRVHTGSTEEHNDVDRTEWRKFLRPFTNVKTLRIQNGLVKDLSCSLQLEDGGLPLDLIPELHELAYYGSGDTGDVFTSFINARRNAGRPISLVRL